MNEAVYMLIGVILGLLGSMIGLCSSYLTNKANLKIENIRKYGNKKILAYQHLVAFCKEMDGACYPDNDIASEFLSVMKKSFSQKILPNYIFYSKNMRDILDEYMVMSKIWNHPDFFNKDAGEAFIDRLPSETKKLEQFSFKEAIS